MPEITPITVRGIINSDQKCFRSLYDAYYAYLCVMAVSLIHDPEKSRELVNDVFLRVWERRAQLKYPPLPYLISGVRKACYNYMRDIRKASAVTLSLMERVPDAPLYDDEEVEDIMHEVEQVASMLPTRCAEVFSLHFFEGMDTAEIAEKLGISPSTIRVQLKIALDKIREKIKK